jgi:Domain of unknown function (DUF4185)
MYHYALRRKAHTIAKPIPSIVLVTLLFALPAKARAWAPYPPSAMFSGITWHWKTLRQAAPGSDLWPVTWAANGSLYAAWGDGGGFGGTDSDGRVAMGFARIQGDPEDYRALNVNGGKNPEHLASFPKRGKTGGILAVGSTLYAWINLQDGKWPDVDMALGWSKDGGATWAESPWRFAKGEGHIKPGTFLNFGRGYAGVPEDLKGFVYFYAFRQGDDTRTFLGRVRETRIPERDSYQYFAGLSSGTPQWSGHKRMAKAVFEDPNGADATVGYDSALKRYLLTAFHTGPGQLGIFEGPEPWGPWRTVAYYERWGGMGSEGEGLTCSFPRKWMSPDGLTLWCVFSAYGPGAKEGIHAHDRFNLVKATLLRR